MNMRKILVLACFLVGCGGAEFASLQSDAAADDAAADAHEDSSADAVGHDDGGSDARGDADTLPLDSSARDAGGDSIAADSAPTCTPFATDWTCVGQSASATVHAPNYYCMVIHQSGSTVGSSAGPTNALCRCTETYTCACLLSQLSGAQLCAGTGDQYGGCTDDAGMLTVTCQ